MNHQLTIYTLPLLILLSLTLSPQPISSFSLNPLDLNPSFTLLGDAQISTPYINLTSSTTLNSHGQVVYQKPFKFLEPGTSKPVSFSTDFSFSISPTNADGLAFVIFPAGLDLSKVSDEGYFGVFGEGYFGVSGSRFVAVEYDTRKDEDVGDVNGNHVGVDVGSFVSDVTADVGSVGLSLNGGRQLRTCIDYEASSKRMEIRLAEVGTERPSQPLISHQIDLGKMWGDKEVLVGISSSSGKSTQMSTSLSSWNFNTRVVPNSMHSMPFNPDSIHADQDHHPVQKKSCFLTVLGAVIFATGCGTLVAFFGLFLWLVLFGRHSTSVVSELPLNAVDFKYEKVNVTVHDDGLDQSRTS